MCASACLTDGQIALIARLSSVHFSLSALCWKQGHPGDPSVISETRSAFLRVREILVGAVVGEYALGSARSLGDFEEHANISFKTLEVGERARAGLTL